VSFCVIRHPEVATPGTCPDTALEHWRGRGWFRVSDWRADASEFHLPDFAGATEDLDADEQAEPVAETEPVPESTDEQRTPRSRSTKESK